MCDFCNLMNLAKTLDQGIPAYQDTFNEPEVSYIYLNIGSKE
jgi:hypothetical protein